MVSKWDNNNLLHIQVNGFLLSLDVGAQIKFIYFNIKVIHVIKLYSGTQEDINIIH